MTDCSVQPCNARTPVATIGRADISWKARWEFHCLVGGATAEPSNLDVGRRSVTVSDNAQATGALWQPIPTVALLRQLIGRKRGCQLSPQAKGGANRVPKRDSPERRAMKTISFLSSCDGAVAGSLERAATAPFPEGRQKRVSSRLNADTLREREFNMAGMYRNACAMAGVTPGLPSFSECLE